MEDVLDVYERARTTPTGPWCAWTSSPLNSLTSGLAPWRANPASRNAMITNTAATARTRTLLPVPGGKPIQIPPPRGLLIHIRHATEAMPRAVP